jgi:outer membrane protein OmpA-like peptidoglycan-associated protein
MKQNRFKLVAAIGILSIAANVGCATKKYARVQAAVVNDRVTQVQTDTNTQIAALTTKHQADISRVEERIATTDNRLATVATTASEASASAARANTTAGQAVQQGETNAKAIQEHSVELSKVAAAQNYNVAETGNVMFETNRSALSNEAKAALDTLIQKGAASPRTFFEVVGYTDPTGSEGHNLTLSEKRADAVARYLATKNVSVKNISLIGLGEEQTPEQLAAEVPGVSATASPKELRPPARRVRVRLYMPGTPETSQRASN